MLGDRATRPPQSRHMRPVRLRHRVNVVVVVGGGGRGTHILFHLCLAVSGFWDDRSCMLRTCCARLCLSINDLRWTVMCVLHYICFIFCFTHSHTCTHRTRLSATVHVATYNTQYIEWCRHAARPVPPPRAPNMARENAYYISFATHTQHTQKKSVAQRHLSTCPTRRQTPRCVCNTVWYDKSLFARDANPTRQRRQRRSVKSQKWGAEAPMRMSANERSQSRGAIWCRPERGCADVEIPHRAWLHFAQAHNAVLCPCKMPHGLAVALHTVCKRCSSRCTNHKPPLMVTMMGVIPIPSIVPFGYIQANCNIPQGDTVVYRLVLLSIIRYCNV